MSGGHGAETGSAGTRIFVDADACPVKAEVVRVAARHAIPVLMVANSWMRLPDGPLVERVVVPDGPDAAGAVVASWPVRPSRQLLM